MIYRKAFTGEALAQSALVLSLLSVLLLLIVTARALADLSGIGPDLADLIFLVLLGMLRYAPLLISFSVVAGLMATFDRMNSGRELLSWEIAGLRPASWLGSTFRLAVPFALLCALMALEGSPWATRAVEKIKRQAIDRAEVVGRTGSFGEIGRLGIIYHITPDRTVLIQQQEERNNIVLTSGGLGTEEGTPVLLLNDGHMYSARRYSKEVYEVDFEAGNIAIAAHEEALNLKLKSTSVRELDLDDRRHRVELLWRLGIPLSLLALALLIPLSAARHSRRARSASILIAVLGYWFFYSAMSLMKELAARSDALPEAPLVLAPVALVLAIAAAMSLVRKRKPRRLP